MEKGDHVLVPAVVYQVYPQKTCCRIGTMATSVTPELKALRYHGPTNYEITCDVSSIVQSSSDADLHLLLPLWLKRADEQLAALVAEVERGAPVAVVKGRLTYLRGTVAEAMEHLGKLRERAAELQGKLTAGMAGW